jgi:TcpE family
VDLPTYTNIWRIEKRLYKLYDFRLPMPLPINWIAVFTGITVPYIILLIAIGLPFNHTLLWLYVLPPGLLTWLTTRPVLEQKRLPELVESQVRYLTEPRTWVRLTPLAEKNQMAVSARVWRGRPASERIGVAVPAASTASAASTAASPAAVGAARGSVARRGRGRTPVPAIALNAAPVPVRDHGPATVRTSRPAHGQAVTSGTVMRPRVLTLGPGGGGRPTPALPPNRPGPPSPTPQPSAPRPRVIPAVVESAPLRARGGAPGAPPLEVSHDRPARRSAPAEAAAPPAPAAPPAAAAPLAPQAPPATVRPVTTLPGAHVGTTWPSPPRPLRPVRTAPVTAPAPTQAAPAEAAPVETAAVETVPEVTASVAAAPVETAPVETVPEETAPEETAAIETPPVDIIPVETVPVAAAPAATVPVETVPEETASVAAGPVEAASVETVPVATAAVAAGPVDVAPEQAAPAEPAPEPTLPTDVPPVAAVPVAAVPAEAVPAEAVPEEIAPVATAPAESAPQVPELPAEAAEARPAPVSDFDPAPPPLPIDSPRPEHAREPAQAAVAAAVQETQNRAVPSIERALSGPAREQNPSWHGKVKIVTGAGASHGPGARDQEALDRNRARLDVPEPRRILVLGCTSGAGQTVTALMTGYMLASLREHPVAVVDLHDGTLARYRAPAAWLDEILAGRPPQQVTSARPDGLNPTPKPNPARLDVIASHQQPRDGDEIKLAVQLNRHYPLTVLDPGPAFLTRLLKITDQLAVVVPANAEAAGALADTRDWLDNNGHAELAMQSVTVINGVSRRSLPDVEHAESIARGRSRAIVRIPWDDMLPVAAAGPSTLRPQTRVAYTALAGVLVAGLASVPVRKKQ